MTDIAYRWRGDFTNAELNSLHADAFSHRTFDDDWSSLTNANSLGWVTARYGPMLVGFVNVIWDGLVHAWIQDVMVASDAQRTGIGVGLIDVTTREVRSAGCEWLHVDFEDHLRNFYLDAAGFTSTNGGLINLTKPGW